MRRRGGPRSEESEDAIKTKEPLTMRLDEQALQADSRKMQKNKKPRGRTGHPVALVGARFPWGSVLALHCGSIVRPVGRCTEEANHLPVPSSHSLLGAFTAIPVIRVTRREEGRRSYSLSSASADRDVAHLWTGAFYAPRMLTPRDRSPILWSLHQTVSTSDVPTVARRHSRVGVRIRPICCPAIQSVLRRLN